MRDRLIELVSKAREKCNLTSCCDCEYRDDETLTNCYSCLIADHLIENGVIVPPVKMRDTVYIVTPGGKIHEKKVLGVTINVGLSLYDEVWAKRVFLCEGALVFKEDEIGKTIFLTREEAEQALKGEQT